MMDMLRVMLKTDLSVQRVVRCETKVKCMRERVDFPISHAHLVALNQLETDHHSTSFA